MQTSHGLEREMSQISSRETRTQKASCSMRSRPNMKVSRVAMPDQLSEILEHCQTTDFVNFLTEDQSLFGLEYSHYGV
jgi:hypothetical protein